MIYFFICTSQQNRRDFTHLAHFAPGDRTEAGICAKQFQKFNLFKSDCFFIEFLAQSPLSGNILFAIPPPLDPCLLGAHDNSFDIGIERCQELREASRHARREQVKSSKVQLSGCFDHQLSKQRNYRVNNASVYYLSHVTSIDRTVESTSCLQRRKFALFVCFHWVNNCKLCFLNELVF